MTAYLGPEGQERGRVSDSSLRPEGRRGHGEAAATEGSGRTAAEEGREGHTGREAGRGKTDTDAPRPAAHGTAGLGWIGGRG